MSVKKFGTWIWGEKGKKQDRKLKKKKHYFTLVRQCE